jgi:transcriptional regulator with XRE-family HTH domain
MTSGVSLREARLARAVQQQEVAAEMGVGHSALAQLERRTNVRPETARRYIAALDNCHRRQIVESMSTTISMLELTRESLQKVAADV